MFGIQLRIDHFIFARGAEINLFDIIFLSKRKSFFFCFPVTLYALKVVIFVNSFASRVIPPHWSLILRYLPLQRVFFNRFLFLRVEKVFLERNSPICRGCLGP